MNSLIVFSLIISSLINTHSITPFEEFLWKNRILIYYVHESAQEEYKKQQELLNGLNSEMTERDLISILISDSSVVKLPDGNSLNASVKSCKEFLSIDKSTRFQINLIGKDGTLKLQESKPIPAEKILKLIDSMPMRKNEMSNQKD